MKKRGRILRDTSLGPGLLTVEGTQYTFLLEGMWRSEVPPRAGMTVEVAFDPGGAPHMVYAVSESRIADEQSRPPIAEGLQVSGGSSLRIGAGTIVAEILILVCFFLLPNMEMGNAYSRRKVNGWEAIGLDPNTLMTNSHGLLSVLAVLCLLAPLGVPLVKQSWSRWLNAAPFAFAVLAVATIVTEIRDIGHQASGAMGAAFGADAGREMSRAMTGMFDISFGAYGVLLCSIYLLTRALRRPS